MTNKVYRTAQGKMVDMGSLALQNEMVRAVGNMNVNARGDRVDDQNRIVDQNNRQVQRRIKRQSNVVNSPVHSSTATAKQSQIKSATDFINEQTPESTLLQVKDTVIVTNATPVDATIDQAAVPAVGLAAALAKAKTVKQELDPSAKQLAQAKGVHKL